MRSRACRASSGCRSRLVTSAPSRGQDRRLVARSGAELEHPVARSWREELGHARDDPGLADRLARVDRHGLVGVRLAAMALIDEPLTRDGGHGLEHALVVDAPGAELLVDHPLSIASGALVAGHVAG